MNDPPLVAVVDDDISVLRGLRRLLQLEGYSVETFQSGPEFLEALEAGCAPSCIILDIRLPGLSGFDVMDRLSARGPSPPVILITGHADVLTAERAARTGCARFLMKPFDIDELLSAVVDALAR
jgi:two-component system response regulator FixJ